MPDLSLLHHGRRYRAEQVGEDTGLVCAGVWLADLSLCSASHTIDARWQWVTVVWVDEVSTAFWVRQEWPYSVCLQKRMSPRYPWLAANPHKESAGVVSLSWLTWWSISESTQDVAGRHASAAIVKPLRTLVFMFHIAGFEKQALKGGSWYGLAPKLLP